MKAEQQTLSLSDLWTRALQDLQVAGLTRRDRGVDRHAEHGAVSIAVYLTQAAAEDVDHLAQLARLRDAS